MLKEVIVGDSFSTGETCDIARRRVIHKSLPEQLSALDTHPLSGQQREVSGRLKGCIDGWIDQKALPESHPLKHLSDIFWDTSEH
jgi:hypothetical protein